MADNTSGPYLSRLSDFIAFHIGLHFPEKRWQDLDRAMRSAAVKLGFEDAATCAQWFLSSPPSRQHLEVLTSCLTVGETYFFREMRSFEVLVEHILPELIASRGKTTRRLRIWSAGCATGEEPYSIAILLDQNFPHFCEWDITILATDINPIFLQKAKESIYSEWSFRNTRPDIKERYFVPTGDRRFKVAGNISKMVTFEYVNLVEDPDPSVLSVIDAMDVIFCRNVLMYFDTAGADKAACLFHHSLTDGGWLIVSPSEASHTLFSEYATANFPGAILFRKLTTDVAECGKQHDAGNGMRDMGYGSEVTGFKMGEKPALIPPVASCPDFSSRENYPEPPCEDTAKRTSELQDAASDLYLEASDLLERGLHKDAAEKTLALLGQEQNDARGMALLARAYANGGETAKALEWCRRAIAAERLNASHYYLLAIVLQEMDQNEAAAKVLRQALFLNQDFVLAHVAFGIIHKKADREELSQKCFRNALTILKSCGPEDIVPESGGMTACSMMEIIGSLAGGIGREE
ncbi:MAG: CheR family methyltransferase [Pseudomonadota bacterium]